MTAQEPQAVATLTYTNWRGETSVRQIIPRSVRYGSTEWHPNPQWLLLAYDTDKQADREFALKDFGTRPALDRAAYAEALWRHEVSDLPAAKRARDGETFSDQSQSTRRKWLGFADAILAMIKGRT